MIFYTNLMPARYDGYSVGPFIFIRPKYKYDIGLLEHEKVHRYQFWTLQFLYKSKLELELAAFREQLKYSPHSLDHFAKCLATEYPRISISIAEAKRLLKEKK